MVPQDVLEDDRAPRQPQGFRRLDEILLLQETDLALDERNDRRDIRQPHDHHDVVDVRLERGDDQEDEHQARERVHEVGTPGDDRIGPPLAESRQHAQGGAGDDRDGDGQKTRQEVGLDPQDQPREKIPPHEIGPQEVAARPR
jgi:hypothetical protein